MAMVLKKALQHMADEAVAIGSSFNRPGRGALYVILWALVVHLVEVLQCVAERGRLTALQLVAILLSCGRCSGAVGQGL
jgi:hypothetical protein